MYFKSETSIFDGENILASKYFIQEDNRIELFFFRSK